MRHPCSSEVAGVANRSGKLQWLDGCLFQGRYEIFSICTGVKEQSPEQADKNAAPKSFNAGHNESSSDRFLDGKTR
jgi:hypothetical protein